MAQKARREGQIKERGPNKWLVSVYLGRGPGGKKVYQARTVHGGRWAALGSESP